jgi:ParB family transcriptional regulator, chromosome partitioning protein
MQQPVSTRLLTNVLAMKGMIMLKKPLSWFKPDPNQPRKTFDEPQLRALGESMKARWQIQPVVAKPDGTILCGERRWRAAQLVGMTELSVIIAERPLSDSEVRIAQLTENMVREDLKAIEQVDGLEELARLNPGMNNKELAELLNIDPSSVTRLRSVARCTSAVREALAAGAIGISDCYALSKADEGEQARLLALKLSGLSRDAIESKVRKQRNGVPAVRVRRIKCPLPSGAMVQVSGTEISLNDMIDVITELLKEAKRASEQGLDCRTFQAVMRDKAKAK